MPVDGTYPFLRVRYTEETVQVLAGVWRAQRDAVSARSDTGLLLLPESWDDRLAEVIVPQYRTAAVDAATRTARRFGGGVSVAGMAGWITEASAVSARHINATTRTLLASVDWDEVFDDLLGGRGEQIAGDIVGSGINFGSHEGARAGGATGKRWQVNSSNPRSSHIALNGAVVGMEETFQNGMRWPRDPSGGADADEIAGCQCSLVYV